METALAREIEKKLHVAELCSDFQKAVQKPQSVVFDYSDEGCMTLVVMLQTNCPEKKALTQLSEHLAKLATEAAAMASMLPDEPEVTIDETNKAAVDA